MQKMGWTQGKGIEKSEQRLMCPIADLPTDTHAPKNRRGLEHFYEDHCCATSAHTN